MLLTVKQLKKVLQNAPDDAIFGSMNFEGNKEVKLYCPKRFLLAKDQKGVKFLLINNMGTHWDDNWMKNLDAGLISSFDRDTGEETKINEF